MAKLSVPKFGLGMGIMLACVQAQKAFTDELWAYSEDIAQKVVETAFIQGIQNGDLDPRVYGGYIVQDIRYIASQRDTFLYLAERENKKDKQLHQFFTEKAENYDKYIKECQNTWFINDEYGIRAGQALQAYLDHYDDVAENRDSIYSAVASLPCETLWRWVADNINDHSVPKNQYQFWINESLEEADTATSEMVNSYHKDNKIDAQLAKDIFRQSMIHELEFFLSATPNEAIKKDEL